MQRIEHLSVSITIFIIYYKFSQCICKNCLPVYESVYHMCAWLALTTYAGLADMRTAGLPQKGLPTGLCWQTKQTSAHFCARAAYFPFLPPTTGKKTNMVEAFSLHSVSFCQLRAAPAGAAATPALHPAAKTKDTVSWSSFKRICSWNMLGGNGGLVYAKQGDDATQMNTPDGLFFWHRTKPSYLSQGQGESTAFLASQAFLDFQLIFN